MGINFIELDRFMSISESARNHIINLWRPQKGDLVCNKNEDLSIVLAITDKFILTSCGDNIRRDKVIPLLNETQLRRIIENKLHALIDIVYDNNDTYNELFEISFSLYTINEDDDFNNIDNYTFKVEDLLHGYWLLLQEII